MRAAVFVDAGYLFAEGSVLLTGKRQGREFARLDISGVVAALKTAVETTCGHPLLRIYWYDAMRLGRPSPEQSRLADADDIKIRLGQINAAGEQKGVDALIVTDLVELARNRAMTDAVLLSGDEDVRVGVLLAQQFGVRLHLVGVHSQEGNQSRSLRQEADTCLIWNSDIVGAFLSFASEAGDTVSSVAAEQAGLDAALGPLVEALAEGDVVELQRRFTAGNRQIPVAHDRSVLRIGREYFGQSTLNDAERTSLRETFIRLVMARR